MEPNSTQNNSRNTPPHPQKKKKKARNSPKLNEGLTQQPEGKPGLALIPRRKTNRPNYTEKSSRKWRITHNL